MRYQVDETRCTHCGACIATCPTDMVRDKRGAIRISFVACIGCGHCMAVCPEGAISLEQIEYEGEFRQLPERPVAPEELLGLLQARRTTRRYLPEPVEREDLERLLEATRWVPTGANCQCQQFTVITSAEVLERLRGEIMDHYRRYAETLREGSVPGAAAPAAAQGADPGETAGGDSPRYDRGQSPFQMHEHILAAVPSFVKNADSGRDRLFFGAPAVILIHAPRDEVLPEAACAFATLAIALMAETLGLGTCITAYASMALQALPDLARQMGVPEGDEVYYVMVVGKPAERYQLIPPRKAAHVTWLE